MSINSIKGDFNRNAAIVIPHAIVLNILLGEIVSRLHLPLFLDSVGTVLVGILFGPWAGMLTGMLSNTVWGLAINEDALRWLPVAMLIGFVAGWSALGGLFKSRLGILVTGLMIGFMSATVSVPISVYLYGGLALSGISSFTSYLLLRGHGLYESVFIANLLIEPIDKTVTCLLAVALALYLVKYRPKAFPRSENVGADLKEES